MVADMTSKSTSGRPTEVDYDTGAGKAGPTYCAEKVYRGRSGAGRCSHLGVVEHGGKWYCRRHDPERVARDRREKDAAYDERRRLSEEIRDRGIALGRRLGVDVDVEFSSGSFAYVKRLTIAFADAECLAARLEAAEGRE